jgi:predicted HTH domain antitoxin
VLRYNDDILQATGLTLAALKRELALLLFQQERLMLGQAARLAGVDQLTFQRLLASRKIAVHYDVHDLDSDIATLRVPG